MHALAATSALSRLPAHAVATQIKARKLHELTASGVPEKYQAELARLKIKSAK